METLIGITESRLQELIATATMVGYERARKDMNLNNEVDDILHSRKQIIDFLYGDKEVSDQSFRRHIREGRYGNAIKGRGDTMYARKSELLHAIKEYKYRIYDDR